MVESCVMRMMKHSYSRSLLGAAFVFASASSNLFAGSIVGSWYFTNPVATGVFTFLSDGRFMGIEDNDPAINGGGQDGLEKGTYTWNPVTGALSINAVLNTNGEWGLCFAPINSVSCVVPPGATLTATDTTLTIFVPGDGSFPFPRLTDPGSPIVGAWYISNGPNPQDLTVIAFLPDGRYMAGIDPPGGGFIEFGSYTWNPLTGAFTATTSTSSAPPGFSINLASFTSANIANGRMVLSSDSGRLTVDSTSVPEPETFALLAAGLTILLVRRLTMNSSRI